MEQEINLFEGAKFGDWYMTSQGYKVRYIDNLGNPQIAVVISPETMCQKHVYVNGHICLGSCQSEKQFIVGRCEADIDEEALAKLANKENTNYNIPVSSLSYTKWNAGFIAGFKYAINHGNI